MWKKIRKKSQAKYWKYILTILVCRLFNVCNQSKRNFCCRLWIAGVRLKDESVIGDAEESLATTIFAQFIGLCYCVGVQNRFHAFKRNKLSAQERHSPSTQMNIKGLETSRCAPNFLIGRDDWHHAIMVQKFSTRGTQNMPIPIVHSRSPKSLKQAQVAEEVMSLIG